MKACQESFQKLIFFLPPKKKKKADWLCKKLALVTILVLQN